MKNKKNHKKNSKNNFYSKAKIFRKNFLRSQRSDWALQKGDGLFISLEVLCSPMWLKISNIGTAWTCRVYIRVLIAYNTSV